MASACSPKKPVREEAGRRDGRSSDRARSGPRDCRCECSREAAALAGAITLQVRSVLSYLQRGKQAGPQNRPGVAPPASRLASPSPAFLQRNTENGCQVSSASGPLLIMLTPRPQGVRPGVEGPVRVGASCAFPFSTSYPPRGSLSEVRAEEVETGGAGRVPAKGLFSPANKDCLLINGERCGRSSPGRAEANEKALFTRPEPLAFKPLSLGKETSGQLCRSEAISR